MPQPKTFDIEIVRRLPRRLYLPEPDECEDGRSPGCNRSYEDLRGTTWNDVAEALTEEDADIAMITDSDDPNAESNERDWNPISPLREMDLGVASTALALAAARCVPVSSCNGGAFADDHSMSNPLVAFYGSRHRLRLLMKCAASAEVGIEQGAVDCLVVHARSVADMQEFAREVLARKAEFDALPMSRQERALFPDGASFEPSRPGGLSLG